MSENVDPPSNPHTSTNEPVSATVAIAVTDVLTEVVFVASVSVVIFTLVKVALDAVTPFVNAALDALTALVTATPALNAALDAVMPLVNAADDAVTPPENVPVVAFIPLDNPRCAAATVFVKSALDPDTPDAAENLLADTVLVMAALEADMPLVMDALDALMPLVTATPAENSPLDPLILEDAATEPEETIVPAARVLVIAALDAVHPLVTPPLLPVSALVAATA